MTDQPTASDLTAWLSARYDERERQARAATPGPWRIGNARYGAATVDGPDALQDGGRNDATGGRLQVMRPRVVVPPDVDYGPVVDVADAAHIAAHDPAWRLADIALKRAILADHPVTTGWDGDNLDGAICERCCGEDLAGGREGDPYPCRTVRLLASEFWDDINYDEGWRP